MVNFDKKNPGDKIREEFRRKIKKQVTIPILSIDGGGDYDIIPISHPIVKIIKDNKGEPKKDDDGKIQTMKIITVIDLVDNMQTKSMVLPAVTYSELKENYPTGFLGKYLNINIPHEKAKGKRYKKSRTTEYFLPDGIDKVLAELSPPIDLKAVEKLNNLTPDFWLSIENKNETIPTDI